MDPAGHKTEDTDSQIDDLDESFFFAESEANELHRAVASMGQRGVMIDVIKCMIPFGWYQSSGRRQQTTMEGRAYLLSCRSAVFATANCKRIYLTFRRHQTSESQNKSCFCVMIQ